MATYSFNVYGFDMFGVAGADPFSSSTNTNPAAVGSVITMDVAASWTHVSVDDDEAMLHDNDVSPQQDLVSGVVLDGTNYNTGTHVETEYSYVVRISSSSNPADNFNIFSITMDGVVVGFASDAPMLDGESYTIVAEGSSGPSVLYDDLVVCFAAGTGILTPSGERRVEALRPGDLVVTADDGPQPVAWSGWEMARGHGRKAPVRIPRGLIGAARDLYVSPQHRILVPGPGGDEVLLPATALVGRDGVRQVAHGRIHYHHLLFDRHQVIFAEGAAAESLYPGPMALQAMGRVKLDAIRRALPGFSPEGWTPARRFLRPGQFRRLAQV